MKQKYDIVIIGAGPAGTSAAMLAHKQGLDVLLVEKDEFPRDKICGDAISGKAIKVLKKLDLFDEFLTQDMTVIDSITFGSSSFAKVNIRLNPNAGDFSKGYVIRRKVLDNFLYEKAKEAGVEIVENHSFKDVVQDETGAVYGATIVDADGNSSVVNCKVLIGADGYSSAVATALGKKVREDKHCIVALRQYYKNVNMPKNAIEIHFLKEVQPGYFWVFPLADGGANVGIGMLHSDTKTKEIDLKIALENAVKSDGFKQYFEGAEPEEKVRAWNLSLGSVKRDISGDGYMLIGDAAGVIDPFSGEGIGNSMYSADCAVEVLTKTLKGDDFSKRELFKYEKLLYKKLWSELRMSYILQRMLVFRPLVDIIVRKASKNPNTEKFISDMIAGEKSKLHLLNPFFYLKIILF